MTKYSECSSERKIKCEYKTLCFVQEQLIAILDTKEYNFNEREKVAILLKSVEEIYKESKRKDRLSILRMLLIFSNEIEE